MTKTYELKYGHIDAYLCKFVSIKKQIDFICLNDIPPYLYKIPKFSIKILSKDHKR